MTRAVFAVLFVTIIFACSAASADEGPDLYLKTVRAYADAMIEHGRDTYGAVQSPLFAAALDRHTLKLLEGDALKEALAIPQADWKIRETDRSLYGANPMHDQNLYQVLYALSEATGERRYADEADKTLKWFFGNCQSKETGLLAWGEHLSWDFRKERFYSSYDLGGPVGKHEFFRPWKLWDRSFELAPEPCQALAVGLWQNQIADHKKGLFSRHASYAKRGTDTGYEMPRHGGFYIDAWAEAYRRSKNPDLLTAIECLVDGFESRRHPKTGAMVSYTKNPDLYWPCSSLSLAIDLHEAAAGMPEPLARKMRACAEREDQVWLKLHHDLEPSGKGFLKWTSVSDPNAGRADKPSGSYTTTWISGYGATNDAQAAMLCYVRYKQTKIEGYRRQVIAAAERYMSSRPDFSEHVSPGAFGDALAVVLAAHRLTGEAKYLNRADALGKAAVEVFFQGSPLPKAGSKFDHYEAITRADTLAMGLLDLWAAKTGRQDIKLEWTDR